MKKIAYPLLIVILLALLTVGCATNVSYPTNDDMLLPFYQNGKFGYINREGKVIIKPKYEAFKDLQLGVQVMDGKKKTDGMFSSRTPIVPNFNIVRNKEHWGVVDNNEKAIIPFKYDSVAFYNGVILVLKSGDKNDVYDITGSLLLEKISGKELIDFMQKPKGPSPYNLTPQRKDGKFGYIDKDGNVVIEHKFAIAHPFKDGLALVKEELGRSGSGYGYIKENGDYFIEPKYIEARSFNEGVAAVREEDSGFYYINTNGERIKALEPKEGYFSGFTFGFSCINGIIRIINIKEGKLRYVTPEGKVIFEGEYWEDDLLGSLN